MEYREQYYKLIFQLKNVWDRGNKGFAKSFSFERHTVVFQICPQPRK